MIIYKLYNKNGQYEGYMTEDEEQDARNFVDMYGGHYEKEESEDLDD